MNKSKVILFILYKSIKFSPMKQECTTKFGNKLISFNSSNHDWILSN